jgi:hypothetical protein
MIHHLATATKVAGLTYRLLSTAVLIGFLVGGVWHAVREQKGR